MLDFLKNYSYQIFLVIAPFFSFGNEVELSSIEFRNLNTVSASENVLIIDARPAVFYELGHIPNAISLPLMDFESSYEKINKEYNLEVLDKQKLSS